MLRPVVMLLLLLGVACSSPDEPNGDGAATAEQRFPDVTGAELTRRGDGTFDVDATLSSPYDDPERYADAWRVRSEDGDQIFGIRELSHDHAGEQPFTRSLRNVDLPAEIDVVVIEGRDLKNGWGGGTVTLTVTR